MADDVQLNAGSGGDKARAIAKTINTAKTQVVILDVGGGAAASPETPLSAGQKLSANSLSCVLASDALADPGGVPITGAAMPPGGVGVTGWLSAIWSKLSGTLTASISGSVAVTGSFWQATQPVSAVALPLPSGAAQETGGNLAATATAAGAPADAAYTGTGSSSIVAALKGIYAKLAGTLTASISGSVAVTGTFWQATQPVSFTGQSVSISGNPVLGAGSSTIGNVGVNNKPVGAATLATAQATPGTTATLLVAARTGAVGAGRVSATLYNFGGVTVFVGPSGVTTANGIPLIAGASMSIDTTAALYGVVATGTGSIGVAETY